MTSAPAPRSNLLRAMLIGLTGGAILGGLMLIAFGLRTRMRGVDCAALSPAECDLAQDIASQFARTQIGFGFGLALLGIGGLVWQAIEDRRRRRSPQEA